MSHTKRWQIKNRITPEAEQNLQKFPSILQQLVFNRGYGTDGEARSYLKAEVDFNTDPFQMTGMRVSVNRIEAAIQNLEPIAIYGDYDVDGVTATALLVEALTALGADVRPYIPNRFEEGYGLNTDALDSLASEGVRLVITVDCGIRSPDEASHAKSLGLDLIITDHHHPAERLPPAFAIINPKQAGDTYPYKDLAGVGIAYKLADALITQLQSTAIDPGSLLDLVALGTVADLAPLTSENRLLVRRGLRQMQNTSRQGLYSLAQIAGIQLENINAGNIGFGLGPRLNAAGRLEEAIASYELLTTTDFMEAGRLAQQLDMQNRERQRITREMQAKAEEIALANEPPGYLLFAAHESFNPGVVGLAAARLTESYYRPAIVAHKDQDFTRASCRSINEFHITDALDQCADLLVRHGGHAAAAGFTVHNELLGELVTRLKSIAEAQLADEDLRPVLVADLEIPLSDLHPALIQHLNYLEPTGYSNPEAIFVSRSLKVIYHKAIGSDGQHLKMKVSDGKISFDAIAFRQGHWAQALPEKIDLMYTFEINEWNGRISYQLNIKDLKATGLAD